MPAASAMLAISRARTIPPDFMILMLTRSAISPRTISIASAGLNTLYRLLNEGRPEHFDVSDLTDRIPGIEPLIVVDPQVDGRGQVGPKTLKTLKVFLVGGKSGFDLE